MKKVKKPWGEELWIAYDNGRYAGKLIGIDTGHRLSKQYHEKKHETLYLLAGRAKVWHGEKVFIMQPKDILVIEPGEVHRFEAMTDCIFIEFSSPELDDVVRLQDDYSRV